MVLNKIKKITVLYGNESLAKAYPAKEQKNKLMTTESPETITLFIKYLEKPSVLKASL
jgi:hypothetical protein